MYEGCGCLREKERMEGFFWCSRLGVVSGISLFDYAMRMSSVCIKILGRYEILLYREKIRLRKARRELALLANSKVYKLKDSEFDS